MFLGEAGYDCGHHFEKFQVTLATAAAHCVMLGKPLVDSADSGFPPEGPTSDSWSSA